MHPKTKIGYLCSDRQSWAYIPTEKHRVGLPPRKRGHTLDELISRITPEAIDGETDWGPAVGGETW